MPPPPPPPPAKPKADWYQVWVDYSSNMPPLLRVLIAYETERRYEIVSGGGELIFAFESLAEAELELEDDEGLRLTGRINADDHYELPPPETMDDN